MFSNCSILFRFRMKKTDIHLHCKDWDEAFDEGDWEPEQIVAKLPTFLKFLRQVQSHVAPHQETIGDEFQPKAIEEQDEIYGTYRGEY